MPSPHHTPTSTNVPGLERQVLRIGTRESKLARLQTDMVEEALRPLIGNIELQVLPISTKGDKILNKPIAALGGTGVFVKELENALLADEVDLVVHSLKDLPTEMPAQLYLAATLLREDPRDAFVSRDGKTFDQLPAGSKIATSSRRRAAQLNSHRKDLVFVDVRGNVPTRLRKLDEGECDGMVLAAAGLKRLGLTDRIAQYFEAEVSIPAAGQGALAVECRENDEFVRKLLAKIDDPIVNAEVTAERTFLKRLGGGCSVPIGVLARRQNNGTLLLRACISDGQQLAYGKLEGRCEDAAQLGLRLAEDMLADGGEEILNNIMARPVKEISPP